MILFFLSQQDAFANFHTYQDVVDQLKVFLSEKNLSDIILFDENEKNKHLVLDDNSNNNSVKVRVFGNVFEFKPKTVKEYVETKYSDETKTKVIQLWYKKETIKSVDYYVLDRLDKNTKEAPIHLPIKINSLKESFKEFENDKVNNLDKWDTRNITSLKNTFESAKNFNQDISMWNTSNVRNMTATFFEAEKFNQPLDKWDVSNVKTMDGLFTEAYEFNQNISSWNTGNVESMNGMFSDTKAFNQNLSKWDVKKVGNYQNFASGLKSTMTRDKLPKFNGARQDDNFIYGFSK
ncbi:BspA family leucine-rich repeat surface protein [Mycoplasma capricolum]|uniref:BspA family leucine-rich repeat surface protein n=1 Tax=Mycoplasma capricolum TaxID=2095 RepID=UPI002FE3C270